MLAVLYEYDVHVSIYHDSCGNVLTDVRPLLTAVRCRLGRCVGLCEVCARVCIPLWYIHKVGTRLFEPSHHSSRSMYSIAMIDVKDLK